MPTTRIAIREGNTSEYKQALMDEIYEAMRETIAIKDGDRLMAITEHDEHAVACGPLLGINRSDDMVQIQVELPRFVVQTSVRFPRLVLVVDE